MPNLNVPFAGQTLILPGAYYNDNVAAALVPAPLTTPPLIFIGFGYGTTPFVPNTYVTPTDLLNAIRGGPCSGFVPFLTNPSTQVNGAQQITFIEVGRNTQSALTLNSGTSGVINLKSTNYGLPSNLLQAQVQTGSLAGKLVTLYDGFSGASFSADNLGVPFQLSYLGAASGVTYSVITSGSVGATSLVIQSSVSGESVTVPLGPGSFSTVGQVAAFLNGTGHYTAIMLSNGNLPSSNLDAIVSGALAASGAAVNVTATLGDIIYWVNTQASSLASATSGAFASSPLVAPTNIGLTPFTGATSVPPTLSDYASGFNLALTIPGWVVFADSNSSGVISLGVQHAVTASNAVNGHWRRFVSGSNIGDSVATTIAQAQGMNAFQATYVYPGIYRNDSTTGVNTLYSGLYSAAAVAGMMTGNPIAMPLTNKALRGTGVEVKLSASSINQLQTAGVLPIFVSPITNVPTVVSDFTTWQIDPNPENVFNQQVACRQFLAYSLVNAVQPYVGSQADPLVSAKILNAVKATLNSLMFNTSNTNGILVSWNPNSLTLVYNGAQQLSAVTVNVVFVGQNRFITETVNVLPLNLSVALAS